LKKKQTMNVRKTWGDNQEEKTWTDGPVGSVVGPTKSMGGSRNVGGANKKIVKVVGKKGSKQSREQGKKSPIL